MLGHASGTKSRTSISDASLLEHCKSEHNNSVTVAISHELIANNNTHAIARRDKLVASGKKATLHWSTFQNFEFFESGENKLFQPTLKLSSNSCLGAAAAMDLFNVANIQFNDSTYGQGANLAMLTLSADVQAEIYAYDARKNCGTVTMYMLEEGARDHWHLTITFYVKVDAGTQEIWWLTPEGEFDALDDEQADYKTFRKNTLMKQKKEGVAMPMKDTDRRIREIIHDLVKAAKGNFNESCVVQYISGRSWVEDPPIKKVPSDEGANKYDLMCRVPKSNNTTWESLSAIIRREWRTFAMTTKALPNHEMAPNAVTLCYKRRILVGGVTVTDVSKSENTTHEDWVIHHVEAGTKLHPDDPGYTATYKIKLNEQCKKSSSGETLYNYALVRACVHPDARGSIVVDGDGKQKGTSAGQYNARGYATGGAVFYYGRYQGTGDNLLKGGMASGSEETIYGIPTTKELQGTLSGGEVAAGRKRVIEYAKLVGCTPDPAGNIKKSDDLKTLDNAVAGGRDNAGLDTLFALTQKAGLKPDGRTDLMPKILGYDIVWDVVHTADMNPDKVHFRTPSEARKFTIGVRTVLAQHTLAYDPAFASVRAHLESETYNPIQYNNNQKGGDKDPAPSQTIGAPTAVRTNAELEKRNAASKASRAARKVDAPEQIYLYMKKYVEIYLNMSHEKLNDGPEDVADSGSMADEWPQDSAEFQLLELLNTDGVSEIPLSGTKMAMTCRQPFYAIDQIRARLEKCTALVDEQVAKERKERLLGLYADLVTGLTRDKPLAGTKRTCADSTTPAGDALEAAGSVSRKRSAADNNSDGDLVEMDDGVEMDHGDWEKEAESPRVGTSSPNLELVAELEGLIAAAPLDEEMVGRVLDGLEGLGLSGHVMQDAGAPPIAHMPGFQPSPSHGPAQARAGCSASCGDREASIAACLRRSGTAPKSCGIGGPPCTRPVSKSWWRSLRA